MKPIGNVPPVPTAELSSFSIILITINAFLLFLSTLSVILRFLSRNLHLSLGIGLDDWTCVGSLVCSYGNFIACVLCATIGRGGYHLLALNLDQLERFLKCLFAYQFLWLCSVTLSKVAVLYFLGRIFPTKLFRAQVAIWTAITIAFWLSMIICLFLQSRPFRAQFRPIIAHQGINAVTLFIAACSVELGIDVAILLLPQVQLWRLQMSLRRKALLAVVLLLGVFTCIAAIFRLIMVTRINVFDITYKIAVPGIWTSIEINLSIICCCAPMFPKIFKHWHDRGFIRLPSYGSGFRRHSRSHSGAESGKTSHLSSKNGTTLQNSERTSDERADANKLYTVHVQTDIEIQHVKMSSDANERDLAKEYGWTST